MGIIFLDAIVGSPAGSGEALLEATGKALDAIIRADGCGFYLDCGYCLPRGACENCSRFFHPTRYEAADRRWILERGATGEGVLRSSEPSVLPCRL